MLHVASRNLAHEERRWGHEIAVTSPATLNTKCGRLARIARWHRADGCAARFALARHRCPSPVVEPLRDELVVLLFAVVRIPLAAVEIAATEMNLALPRCLVVVQLGDSPFPMDNGGFLDVATLAIFQEYLTFDGEDVLQLAVPGASGRTINLRPST